MKIKIEVNKLHLDRALYARAEGEHVTQCCLLQQALSAALADEYPNESVSVGIRVFWLGSKRISLPESACLLRQAFDRTRTFDLTYNTPTLAEIRAALPATFEVDPSIPAPEGSR